MSKVTMRVAWIAATAAVVMFPAIALAQGVVRGAQDGSNTGARAGQRVGGPVGGAVGGAVGGVAGGVTGGVVGGVKGVLGVPQDTRVHRAPPRSSHRRPAHRNAHKYRR